MEAWARNGLTDEQIATNMGIDTRTLYRWKNQHCQICHALKKGKEIVDIQVENALLKRALGYSYIETVKERIIDTGQKRRHGGESKLTEKEWNLAIIYFGKKCCYCGKDMDKPTKDHVNPLKNNGTLSANNTLPCCGICNSSKKDNEMLSWYKKQPFFSTGRLKKIKDYFQFVSELEMENETLLVTKEITKEVLPDVTAQIFWLKNRQRECWQDRPTVQIQQDGNNDVVFYIPDNGR